MLATVWLLGSRPAWSGVALATAVHVKLVPAILIPAFAKRLTPGQTVLLGLVLVGLVLPYAVFGPAVGAGLFAYAERWEPNAFVYAGVEALLTEIDTGPPLKRAIDALKERFGDDALDWGVLYRHVWPRDVARAVVALCLLAWVVWLAFRPGLDVFRESFLAMGAVLVLSPTVHPWYVLWVLPFAVAYRSWAWLWFAATVPLVYLSAPGAEVGWGVRLVEWLPTLTLLTAGVLGRRRGNIAR